MLSLYTPNPTPLSYSLCFQKELNLALTQHGPSHRPLSSAPCDIQGAHEVGHTRIWLVHLTGGLKYLRLKLLSRPDSH